MKKLLFVLVSLIAFSLVFTACEKEEEELQDTTEESMKITSEDLTALQTISEDIDEEIDLQLEEELTSGEISERSACPTVTSIEPRGTFPNTITLDFGDGCTGRNGREMQGQIIIDISAEMSTPGATRTVTFVNFFVDDAQVEGTKVRTNLGLNDNGKPCWSRVSNITLTFPDGTTASHQADHTICKIAGVETNFVLDDVWRITGGSSGINRHGNTFSSTILEPLIKPRNCHYIVKGVVEITRGDRSRTIDYGNGMCDRIAILTLGNGDSYQILLKPWWRR